MSADRADLVDGDELQSEYEINTAELEHSEPPPARVIRSYDRQTDQQQPPPYIDTDNRTGTELHAELWVLQRFITAKMNFSLTMCLSYNVFDL